MSLRRILSLCFVINLIGFSLAAESLTGKEIAVNGKKISIEGIANLLDEELCIEYEDELYQIHMGPEEYSNEIGFSITEGDYLFVTGNAVGLDLAPEQITLDGNIYLFRDTVGNPMWRGKSYSGKKGVMEDEH